MTWNKKKPYKVGKRGFVLVKKSTGNRIIQCTDRRFSRMCVLRFRQFARRTHIGFAVGTDHRRRRFRPVSGRPFQTPIGHSRPTLQPNVCPPLSTICQEDTHIGFAATSPFSTCDWASVPVSYWARGLQILLLVQVLSLRIPRKFSYRSSLVRHRR